MILKSNCGVISGVGQVGYDVILNRKKRSNVKELIKEVSNMTDKLDQVDKQKSELDIDVNSEGLSKSHEPVL